jgi:predicted RNase H-like nuclease
MPTYLGVDWAGSCWLVVSAGDTVDVTTEPSFLNVWHEHGRDAESILVDIPIGLPDAGTRACDEAAMDYLGSRRSTVFAIPPRAVVETDDYDTARERNGDSLGSQSWWLFPRIREVDVFLQEYADATDRVYESHPEVCFAALCDAPLPPKDTQAGRDERLALLGAEPALHECIEGVLRDREDGTAWHDRISSGKRDDVLDAAVLAYTAAQLDLGPRESEPEYPRLPAAPDEDSELGLPMEIVHPS